MGRLRSARAVFLRNSRQAIAVIFAVIFLYSLVSFVGLARDAWGNQFTDTTMSMQRVHYELSESARLYPLRIPHRILPEAISSLRFLCERYQREAALLQAARDQFAPMRPRLERMAEYMADACGVERRLVSTASALELEQAGSDFRTNLDRALEELSSAVMEHGSLSPEAARRTRSIRLFELGVLATLMLAQLGWLWWWRRGGSRGPREEAAAPGTAPWMRLAVEAVPDGILMADATGRIRSANPAAERLLGYGRGDLAGLPIERVVPGLPSFDEQPHGFVERAKLPQPNGTEVERRVSWFRRRGQSAAPALIFLQPVTPAVPSKSSGAAYLDAETVRQLEDQILLVSGYSEIAAANLPEHDPVREDLEQLARAAAYATLLCRQAGAEATAAAGAALPPMALNPFAATLAHRIGELLEAGTEVTLKTDSVAGTVHARAEMVELALLGHLVRNVAAIEPFKGPRQVIIATELGKLGVTVQARGASPVGWSPAPDAAAGGRAAELLAAQGVECRMERAPGAFRVRLEWQTTRPGNGGAVSGDRERGLAVALSDD